MLGESLRSETHKATSAPAVPRFSEHDCPQPQPRKMSSSEEQASAEALQRLVGMDSSHKFFKWGLFFFSKSGNGKKNSSHISEIQF